MVNLMIFISLGPYYKYYIISYYMYMLYTTKYSCTITVKYYDRHRHRYIDIDIDLDCVR